MTNENLINIAVLAAGLLQGILITIVLLAKGKLKKYPGVLLFIFILVITLQILFKLLNSDWLLGKLGGFYHIFNYIPYLYGPITYLYISKSFAQQPKFKLKDSLHLIPFALSCIIVITASNSEFNIFNVINNDVYNFTDTFIQLMVLTVYIYASKKVLKNISKKEKDSSLDFTYIIKWFSNFAGLVWLIGTVVIITLTLVFYNFKVYNVNYFFLTLPLFLYWISYKALTQPEIFMSSSGVNYVQQEYKNGNEKYKKTGLDDSEAEQIAAKLNTCLEQEAAYLDPNISLEKLSVIIAVPKHHLSQVINQKLGKSFNDLINERRVQKAQSLLKDTANNKYTVAAIAFESGFNSISSFNDVFKKYTGVTPSKFRNLKDI